MKFGFAILLLIGVLSIGVFGFMGMNHKDGHHMGCIAVITNGIDCANQSSIFNIALYHMSAFKAFSFGILGQSAAVALWAITIFVFILFGAVARKCILKLYFAVFGRSSDFFGTFFFPIQQKLARWLSLHTNSPAIR